MNSYDEKNQSIKTNPENDTDDKDMKTVVLCLLYVQDDKIRGVYRIFFLTSK